MSAQEKQTAPNKLAVTLTNVVKSFLEKNGTAALTKEPEIVERDIIEYESRMRVFGMEKFNAPCYISVVNFYPSQKDLEAHNACGALVLYLQLENADKLLKALGHRKFDDGDDEVMLGKCGELSTAIAESFKNEIGSQGSRSLVPSAPLNYKNVVPEGVEFDYNEHKLQEVSFYLWKEKVLAFDVTLTAA